MTRHETSLFDIKKDYVYSLFYNYFDNPTMYKIKDNEDKDSIYGIRVHSLLGLENRYIIVTTPKDNNPKGSQEKMKDLFWTSLQTRSLENIGEIPIHYYKIKRDPHYQNKIMLEKRQNSLSIYNVENLSIKVSLIHKTSESSEYQREGNLINALETFSTIITFV